MAKSCTSFTSEYQPKDRPTRGKAVRTKIIEALARAGKTEEEFYDLLVERALNPDDPMTFKELTSRLAPQAKPVSPLVEFEFDKEASPSAQAAYVLEAIASGGIPSDIGNAFIQSIKTMIDIEEFTSLKSRIEEIEKSLGVSSE